MYSKKYTMIQLRELCKTWAEEIAKEYRPDLIIFIAKSGYIVADEFAKVFDVPMDEVKASRSGGKLRKVLAPFFRLMPLSLRNRIVGSRVMYMINDKKGKRNISVPDSLIKLSRENRYKSVLLVDDSIDTGWSFVSAYDTVKNLFQDADISTLALIKMTYSEKRFSVDYYFFIDTLLMTPAQTDSEEYNEFLHQYKTWREDKDKGNTKNVNGIQ